MQMKWSIFCYCLVHLVLILAVVLQSVAAGQTRNVESVQLNPESTVFDSIAGVEHDAKDRAVRITMKEGSRCSRPSFVLRLSGPALYNLDQHRGSSNRTQIFRYPELIDPGRYFLEVIVIYCAAYNPNSAERQCVETVHFGKNVVTLNYSFIAQPPATPMKRSRWAVTNTSIIPTLLRTRHQRLITEPRPGLLCEKQFEGYCYPEWPEIDPYFIYSWIDGPDWVEMAQRAKISPAVKQESDTSNPQYVVNICFVGDSHSRQMYFDSLGRTDTRGNVTFTYVFSLFPPLFNATVLAEKHCSVAVISYGLWSLSRSPYPHTQRMHIAQMNGLIRKVVAHRGPTRLFVRSENHNGLGSEVIACPGRDRRSPPAFDMVNRITREICERRKVPFIDLDPIIYPMWDAGFDFCHPQGQTIYAEVSLILYRVFRYLSKHNLAVATYPAAMLVQNITNAPSYAAQDAQVTAMKVWLETHSQARGGIAPNTAGDKVSRRQTVKRHAG